MLGKTYDSQVCSIARALEVVGERWSLLILRNALFAGSTRYSHFEQNLGIATNILKTRLDSFVEAGLMHRRPYSKRPTQHEYLLTDKGRDFAPTLIALTEWGDKWAAPDGPPIIYKHTTCDSTIHHQLACDTCGQIDDLTQLKIHPGPGMPPDLARRITSRE